MDTPLSTTFRLLARTENEAAVDVLVAALDSPQLTLRDAAVRALIQRTSAAGHAAVIQRLPDFGDDWQKVIGASTGHMSRALRAAVLSNDGLMCENACRLILGLREYDLLPALVAAMEDPANRQIDLAARTLLDLTELFYQELAAPRDYRNRRDPQLVRKYLTSTLEQGLSKYDLHKRRELIEAFLILAARDNCTLKLILGDPFHICHLPIVDVLLHSDRGGVMRLLLGYLDDPQAPYSAISALARRSDEKFIRHVLKKIGFEPTAAAAHNLKRVESVSWLLPEHGMLDALDDAGQFSAVRMLMATGTKRLEAFRTIEHLATKGTPGGRRAAFAALAEFNGAEANALALKGLSDPDPLVQAAVARQLRPRGVPGALTRLVELMDSRHQAVRDAVTESLAEFRFKKFVTSFDLLEPASRQSTGKIVRKVDPQAIPLLKEEMASRVRTRRLRSVEMAVAMDVVAEMEQPLLALLNDEDHMVRGEAARVLAACDSPEVEEALRHALADRSAAVQETARRSLDEFAERRESFPTVPIWNWPSAPGSLYE